MWTMLPISNAQWESLLRDFKAQSLIIEDQRKTIQKYIDVVEIIIDERKKGNIPDALFDKLHDAIRNK